MINRKDKNIVTFKMALPDIKYQTKPDEERTIFLKSKPWWTEKHTQANEYLSSKFPGTHLVAHPSDSEEIAKFDQMQIDTPKADEVKLMPLIDSECHKNSMVLLYLGVAIEMRSGYALSDDGLWRHHSWAIDKDGRIIETTMERLAYATCNIVTELKFK